MAKEPNMIDPRSLDESTWVRIRFSVDISADKLGEVLKNIAIYAAAQGIKLTVDNISYDNPNTEIFGGYRY